MFVLGDIVQSNGTTGIVTEVSRTGRDWVRYTLGDGTSRITERDQLELVLRVPEVAHQEIAAERSLDVLFTS